MNSDSKILHYTRLVPMDYMSGPDSDAVVSYAYSDIRTELAKSLMENMKTSEEYIVKFDRLTGEDQFRRMYRIDGYLSMKPVLHGHWEECDSTDVKDAVALGYKRCSICHDLGFITKDSYGYWISQTLTDYCPSCGAKMDEEGKECEKW